MGCIAACKLLEAPGAVADRIRLASYFIFPFLTWWAWMALIVQWYESTVRVLFENWTLWMHFPPGNP